MPKVIVVGSLNLDRPWRVDRHPRVGETVLGQRLAEIAGGKGLNQAVAARRMGADAVLVGRVGDDAAGERLRRIAEAEGVSVEGVGIDRDSPTGTALIVVDRVGANTVTVDPGANATLRVDTLPVEPGDLVVAQTEVPVDAVRSAFELARRVGAITLLNPSPIETGRAIVDHADVVVVNEHEAAALVGASLDSGSDDRAADVDASLDPESGDGAAVVGASLDLGSGDGAAVDGGPGGRLADLALGWARAIAGSSRSVVVTLGGAGLVAWHGGRAFRIRGRSVEVVDTVGAGDCLLGSLAARLAAGDDWERALDLANRAAALAVGRRGAMDAMPRLEEARRNDRRSP